MCAPNTHTHTHTASCFSYFSKGFGRFAAQFQRTATIACRPTCFFIDLLIYLRNKEYNLSLDGRIIYCGNRWRCSPFWAVGDQLNSSRGGAAQEKVLAAASFLIETKTQKVIFLRRRCRRKVGGSRGCEQPIKEQKTSALFPRGSLLVKSRNEMLY